MACPGGQCRQPVKPDASLLSPWEAASWPRRVWWLCRAVPRFVGRLVWYAAWWSWRMLWPGTRPSPTLQAWHFWSTARALFDYETGRCYTAQQLLQKIKAEQLPRSQETTDDRA